MITESMGLESSFVPKFNGNRALPTDEQIKVIFSTPTLSMKRRLTPKPEFKFNYDAAGNAQGGTVNLSGDTRPLLDGMLLRIEKLAWRDDKGVEHQIKDVKSLYEAPAVFDELAEEIGSHFREELQKKISEKN